MSDFTLDRSSSTPLYHQLFMKLRAQIMDGTWQHGDFLPTESELEEMYQVSRITVRKALESLVKHNLISRRQGRGTIVLRPMVLDDFGTLYDGPSAAGGSVAMRILATDYAPASDLTAKQLAIDAGEELGILKYLRLVGGEPQCIEEVAFVHRLCPKILEKADLSATSFYHILARDYAIRLVRATYTVSVATASAPDVINWLHLEEEQPVLYVERLSYTQADVPFEHARIFYRPDRFALRFESTRRE